MKPNNKLIILIGVFCLIDCYIFFNILDNLLSNNRNTLLLFLDLYFFLIYLHLIISFPRIKNGGKK